MEENAMGDTFIVPVEALTRDPLRAAPSKSKEMGKTDAGCSVPIHRSGGRVPEGATPKWRAFLSRRSYTVSVQLEGGSGKASVASPGWLQENGGGLRYHYLSSSNYDYMKVDGEKYDPLNAEGERHLRSPFPPLDRNARPGGYHCHEYASRDRVHPVFRPATIEKAHEAHRIQRALLASTPVLACSLAGAGRSPTPEATGGAIGTP